MLFVKLLGMLELTDFDGARAGDLVFYMILIFSKILLDYAQTQYVVVPLVPLSKSESKNHS